MSSKTPARNYPQKRFFYALAGSVLLSTTLVTGKYGLRGFNPETFSLVWTSSASAYSLIIVLVTGHWRQMAMPARALGKIGVMGLATGVRIILAWSGLAQLDPSFQAFLWRFVPVMTILLGALVLGERLMVKELVPMATMVAGGSLGAIGRWHTVGTGMILTILASCAFAVQMLMAKMTVGGIHPNILVVYRAGIGALIVGLWTLLSGKAHLGVEAS